MLEGYDEIVPGAAERIIRMAEQDAAHQRAIENNALQSQVTKDRLGQYFGFAIGLAALLAAIVALFLGYEKAAMVLGGTTVVGLVAVFVAGRLGPAG